MPDLDDEAITITLPPEYEDDGSTKVKVEDGKAKPAADDPIEDLKGQFAVLKNTNQHLTQRVAGAEQQLAAKDQELTTARKEVVESQLDTVTSGLAAAEAEAESAEKDYIAAAEAGDFVAQARAQRKMAAAENKIGRLKEAEGDLKEAKEHPPVQRQETPQRAAADPVEAFTQGMSPKSATWIRSHPDCVTDDRKRNRMLAAHNLAVADDIAVDSDEYFSRIEAGIAPKAAARAAQEQQEQKSTVQIRPSSAAAPSGNAGGGMNGGGTTVTLTKREVEAATDGTHTWERDSTDGKHKRGEILGVQEFARRKAIMQKDGLYDRTFTS